MLTPRRRFMISSQAGMMGRAPRHIQSGTDIIGKQYQKRRGYHCDQPAMDPPSAGNDIHSNPEQHSEHKGQHHDFPPGKYRPQNQAHATAGEKCRYEPKQRRAGTKTHASPRDPGVTAGTLRRCGGSLSAGQAFTFHSASAINGTPTLASPPERSIRQQAATTLAPVILMAVMHSRDETPVETMSSTISTFWPFFRVKLRRSWNSPSTRSTYKAGRPIWRPFS